MLTFRPSFHAQMTQESVLELLKLSSNVDECKPLPAASRCTANTVLQGLTLVHYSAQLEPFLTPNTPQTPSDTP